MSEMDKLLQELQGLKIVNNKVNNTKEVWSSISSGDWQGGGFNSEEEMKQWISENPYINLS